MPKLKMYRAKNGDAFLIELAEQYILIDAGYASTFCDEIVPDLLLLRQAGKRLSLVLCTHIDMDHIGGMIEFISSNGPPEARHIIEVDEFWHNSLRSLPEATGLRDSREDQLLLQAIQRRGYPSPVGSPPTVNPVGARQGSSLARLLKKFGYRWNGGDGTRCIQTQAAPMELARGVDIHVIGPSQDRLEALRSWWIRELQRLSYRGSGHLSDLAEDAYEMSCASVAGSKTATVTQIAAGSSQRLIDTYIPDTSLTNGSSIATILRGEGTSMLFLGDAWAEDIVSRIKATGLETAIFDVIKVAHHGSKHNCSVELLQHIDASCFLISSDGSRHGHPDFEVLAEIVDRPATFERRIYFNYETPAAKRLSKHTSRSNAPFSVRIAERGWINIGGNEN
ncbi:AVAST type 1 anti-phage system MBL fold metallo-hydrolase Avs1a [Burkholderia aenigmatica]|uniref:Metallo-beta-lactamase domain-containing protein n=1 Tax=Burkholderia aenigmatica TaxID=2015348 RepID=A0A228IM98_9BURK|nr:AVAST type 1 anti-phage system MBL fold metallo-hydrolase Avs1a [Burkholderia aenigmatica]OXI43524.1 hypothetical protein CFB84_18305 [Burkholderia aenigmatica]